MMNNVVYNQIRIFQSIVQEGSISAAARKLEITPPSVSKALKLLEQHLGHALFIRNTRHIELTDVGKQLLEQTADAVERLTIAVHNLKDQNQELSGVIKLTIPRFAYLLILKPHMAEFCALHPQIQLEVSVNDATINIIHERFDVGIRFGDMLDGGVVARQLMQPFREGLYASQQYLNQYGLPQTPNDLYNHKLIGYRFIKNNRMLPLILDNHHELISMDIPCQLTCNDIEVIADGVRSHLGIGRLFTPIYQLLADKAQFIPVLEDYWRAYPAVYIYYPKATGKMRKVKALIDFLLQKMGH